MKPIKSVINNPGEDIINLDLTKNVATNKVNGLPFTLLGGATYTPNSYLEVIGTPYSGTMGAVAYEDVSSPLYPQEGFDLELTFAVNYLSPYTGGSEGSYALVASFARLSTLSTLLSSLSISIDLSNTFAGHVFGATIVTGPVSLFSLTKLRVAYTKADSKLTVVYMGSTYTATVDTANTLFKREFRNSLVLGKYNTSTGSFASNGNFRFYSVKLRGTTNKVEPIVYCDFINYPFVNDVGRGSVTTSPQCTQDTSVYPNRAKVVTTSITLNRAISFSKNIDMTRDFQLDCKFSVETNTPGSSYVPLEVYGPNGGIAIGVMPSGTTSVGFSLFLTGVLPVSYTEVSNITSKDWDFSLIKRGNNVYVYINSVLRMSQIFSWSNTSPTYPGFGGGTAGASTTVTYYISDIRAFYLEPPKRRLLSIKPVTGSPITDGTEDIH